MPVSVSAFWMTCVSMDISALLCVVMVRALSKFLHRGARSVDSIDAVVMPRPTSLLRLVDRPAPYRSCPHPSLPGLVPSYSNGQWRETPDSSQLRAKFHDLF